MAVRLRMAGATDTGKVREHNEDVFEVVDLASGRRGPLDGELGEAGALAVVCDGLGGSAGGEVASAIAAGALRDHLLSAAARLRDPESRAAALRDAVTEANRRVHEQSLADRAVAGMGTTLTAALIAGREMRVAQVGDSRAYLLRDGRLTQVTRDQSLIAALVDMGVLTGVQAAGLAAANVLLQAVGTEAAVEIALSRVPLCRGDRVLLCSDGLTVALDEDDIRQAIEDAPSPEATAGRLVAATCKAGAPDNVTVVVAYLSGDGLPEPDGPLVTEEVRI